MIDKLEDLTTNLKIKSAVCGNLEELISDNEDTVICNRIVRCDYKPETAEEPTNYPINFNSTKMWEDGKVVSLTGQKETILGHCYLIKKNVKYQYKSISGI